MRVPTSRLIICLAGSLIANGSIVADGRQPAAVADDLAARLDKYMGRVAAMGFSGAVIVVRKGKVLLEKGYGVAISESSTPVTRDTVFPVGSITKQFTAAGVLKLEMQGKLRVTDSIEHYFRNVPEDKRGITLHDLLTHTAGLESDYGSDDEKVSLEEFVNRVFAAPLRSEPGKQYHYSNAGYSLLAAVIEKLSSQSWERYLHDNLFEPAGMSRTGCLIPHWKAGELAHGYANNRDEGTFLQIYGPDGPYWNQRGNGGILSTIGDMYRWHVALLANNVLSAEAKTKAYTPYARERGDSPSAYGYGWRLSKTPQGTHLIAHNGGNGVFAAGFMRFIDDDVVIYSASNHAEMMAWQLNELLDALVFGRAVRWPPVVVALDASVLKSSEGTYRLLSGAKVDVSVENGHLVLAGDGQEAVSLIAGDGPERSKRSSELTKRAEDMLNAERQGDYRPLQSAFGGRVTLAELGLRRQKMFRDQEREYGSVQKIHILGTTLGPLERATTVVKVDFQERAVLMQYVWTEDKFLIEVAPLDVRRSIGFFPRSPIDFAAFDLEDGKTIRISFPANAGKKSNELVLHSTGGDVRAQRVNVQEGSGR